MLDVYQPSPAAGSDRINIVAIWEVNYWATRWGITPEQLFFAVAEVGDNVREVQAYLARTQREAMQALSGRC